MLSRLLLLMMMFLPLRVLAEPVILVYGDSLSAAYGISKDSGWVALLQNRLRQSGYPYTVVNASISGETSSGGLSRIEETLRQHHPQLVILELGANDGLRGLPVTQMRQNLGAIIEACRSKGAKILLAGMRIPPNYGPRYANSFSESYPLLAEKYNIPVLAFLLENVAGHRELTQEDGLHPVAEAQPAILDNVWRTLLPLLGDKARQSAPADVVPRQ